MNTRFTPRRLALLLAIGLSVCGSRACGEPKATAGFTHTQGGRGGQVLRVTNLDNDGPGSLRAALATKGPRIVVFEVAGIIDLAKRSLVIAEPFLTVAGQTAPSPGITIIRGAVYIKTHDVKIQHVRIRPGDAGQRTRGGWEPDGISTVGADAHDIVVDHCSISWAVDENLSASGPRTDGAQATSHRVTFSNCIIAEGLSHASHVKGEHSKGSLIHDFCRDVAVVGNLYAHNVQRNPYFKAHTTGVIVNNVIYNPGSAAIQLDYSKGEWRHARYKPRNSRVSIVGNVLIHGQDTEPELAMVSKRGDARLEDNVAFRRDGKPAPLRSSRIVELDRRPTWPAGLDALPVDKVFDHVLSHAGARPADRDDVDRRIVRDVRNRRGRVINSQDDVGGYPRVKPTTQTLCVPSGDQRIDRWLDQLAARVGD